MRGHGSRAGVQGEWRWVAGCAAFAVLLVVVPYAFALLNPPEGYLLERTLYYGNDLSQYLAAMGDGASSPSWLIQDHLTAEPHSPAFMYPFYVLLGKVSALLGLPPVAVFAVASLLAIAALVFAAYYFAAICLATSSDRRVGLLFVLLASGVGVWVAMGVTGDAGDPSVPAFSFDRAEVSTYLLPFGPPHLTLALALFLVWGRALVEWIKVGPRASLALVIGSVVGIGLLNPFTLASVIALSCGYVAWRWVAAGRFPTRAAVAAAAIGLAAAPLLTSSLLTFALDPFWSVTYGRQNTTGSPPPWTLLVDFGLLVPLAVAGAFRGKAILEGRTFLVFWVVALLALMYVPVPFQRRFGFGLQPAIAVLAAIGTIWLWSSMGRGGILPRLGLRTCLALGLFSATLLGYGVLFMAAAGIGPLGATVYEPRGNVEAADWLAKHSTERDVVLASVETANYLAGHIRGRVVVAHRAGTLDYEDKESLMKGFFSAGSGPAERLDAVRRARATLVFVGPREVKLGAGVQGAMDGFQLMYDADGVRLYRVEETVTGISSTSNGVAQIASNRTLLRNEVPRP